MSLATSYASSSHHSTPKSSPDSLPVCFENIPEELRERPQWVVWKWEQDPESLKWKKPPFSPRTGSHASHSDPNTWSTYDEAVTAYQNSGFDGIGFVFTDNDEFCGVDLDKCRDRLTGEIKPWAMQIIQALDSYTEVSPSGTGVKTILIGKLPPNGHTKGIEDGKIELYDRKRYFTITGHGLQECSRSLRQRQTALDQVHKSIFPQPAPTPQSPNTNTTPNHTATNFDCLSDEQIMDLLQSKPKDRNLWNGNKRLWEGTKPRFPSQSEADSALVARIARFTQDTSQIDRLFRQSGLMRQKWDVSHYANGATYGTNLINITIASSRALLIQHCPPPEGYHIHHDDYFEKLRVSRSTMPLQQDVFLDRSPCGIGKSEASLQSYAFYDKTLTVCPTHENCEDFVTRGIQLKYDIQSRPKLSPSTCGNFEKAFSAQESGLSFEESVCPDCPVKHHCGRSGYRKQVKLFKQAKHQVITHERAARAGLEVLSRDMSLIVIQEKALDFLRDSSTVAFARFDELRSAFTEVSQRHTNDPKLVAYACTLLQTIQYLQTASRFPFLFQIQKPQFPQFSPNGWQKAIYDVMIQTQINIDAEAIQGVMNFVAGRAEAFYRPEKSGKWGHPNQIVFARKNSLPERIPIVVEDGSANVDLLRRVSGRPLYGWKSIADPEALQRVVQIPRDYQKETSSRKVVDQVRGVLLARPNAMQIGVITHSDHFDAVDQIEQPFRDRIEIIDYFWSGNTRASNKWYRKCDLLIIIGTPRPGEDAVQEFLLRHDSLPAAQNPDLLTEAIALGTTESGRQRAFLTLSHRDPGWNDAYRQLVVAEIMQAVGRSRFIRLDGIPETIVFSNEVLELPLSDEDISPISKDASDLYSVILSQTVGSKPVQSSTSHRVGGTLANRIPRGGARKVLSIYRDFRAPLKVSQQFPSHGIGYKRLSTLTGRMKSTIRGHLCKLREAQLIGKCSQGGDWPISR